MTTNPIVSPSYRSPNTLISPSTYETDEDEKQRRIHFSDGHNTTPIQLARSCFPYPVLLELEHNPITMTTKQHYRLLIQQFQGQLQSLFGVQTNHCSTRKRPHFDPRLQDTFIPRIYLDDRRQLILWCAHCEGNSRFSPICQLRLSKQSFSSDTELPSLTVVSLFYHQCSQHRKPTGDILSNDGFLLQPLDYNLIIGSLFNNVLQKLENYIPQLPSPSPILTPEEQRLLHLRVKALTGDASVILPSTSTPLHHWNPPMLRTDDDIPHHLSTIYHRTSGCLPAPFHPSEFNFDTDHYLSFIAKYGIHISSLLGITNEFSPFHFDIKSYQQDSRPSCTTSSNLSKFFSPNPSFHLSFSGFNLLLGGDELICYSPWKTYGEGFHVDVAPRHILRNIPQMDGCMVPFSTLIPLGFDHIEYAHDELTHRIIDINNPHNKTNVVFGNHLFLTGDTIHQDTTNSGDACGLYPSLIGHISSSKVDLHLPTLIDHSPIDPVELTPINTLCLDIHQIKNFILSQKRQLLDFLKCATPHMEQLRIQSEDPDNLQSSAQFRECYDFLHHSYDYLFPFELSLSREYFTGLTISLPSSTETPQTISNTFQPTKKFDSNQTLNTTSNSSFSSEHVFSSGRVPFLDSGCMTYIRGLELEELTQPNFLQFFDRSRISWQLYDVSGNGNCGFYVHQCHLELHHLLPPITVTQFRKDLYTFAERQFNQLHSPNEWWTYFGIPKNETRPKKLQRLTESTDNLKAKIKFRLIGQHNFENGCSKSKHMTDWENRLLFHRFKYEIVTFHSNQQLFTHIFYDSNNNMRFSNYSIHCDSNKIPSWSDSIVKKLYDNPKSVMFRRFIQLNSSSGSGTIGHFQWLSPKILSAESPQLFPDQVLPPGSSSYIDL